MIDILPRIYTCEACGFMSTRGQLFELQGNALLCKSCVKLPVILFYYEAGVAGLIPGRSIYQAHDSLCYQLGLENITVFREASAEDIARVEAQGMP